MDCPIPNAKGLGIPEGTGANGVLILGEALGAGELADGCLPFRPQEQAGSVLERAIRRAGYNRDQFVLYNAVPTHPPNDYLVGAPWEDAAVEWGKEHVASVIAKYKPRVILALGNTALRSATGLCGKNLTISHLAGFVLPSRYDLPNNLGGVIPCIPSFHPAFLRRGKMSHFGVLLRTLRLANEVARGGRQPLLPPIDNPPAGYKLYPDERVARDFLVGVKSGNWEYLAYDIETPYSGEEDEAEEHEGNIISIQFSLQSGTGIYFPWRHPFIEIAAEILSSPIRKLSWNGWKFDRPRLAKEGVEVLGEDHDLMWAWHHIQPDLPRKLQFAVAQLGWGWPWKHLNSAHPQFYGVVDVDILHWARERIFTALAQRGVMRGYQKHIIELEPILKAMGARGIPVNPTRFAEVKTMLTTDMEKHRHDLQSIVPEDLKPFDTLKKEKPGLIPMPDGRFKRMKEWKPSNKSLTAYMRAKGHPVPKAIKTGADTSNQLELKRLFNQTHDPLYAAVLNYRKAQTFLKNHVKNWSPLDGRVHPDFYFDPATGQLSSRRPNAQNAPHHDDPEYGVGYADAFRSMVEARPGHLILEFDYSGFHVQTLGFEARDLDLMRIGRLDIHSFVTAHFKRLDDADKLFHLPDDELRDRLAWIKKNYKHDRDAKVKHAILGYNNGLGYKKLYKQYKEYFKDEREAKQTLKLLDTLFPKAKAYRDAICLRAHEQGFLISRHGYIRYFWEVFRWKGGTWQKGGDDHEAALCFYTQNDAHGELKDRILALDRMGLLARYNFINTIHDSLMFECPIPLIDECIATVQAVMESPSTVLIDPIVAPNGLRVAVEVKGGPNWASCKKIA